ncbi:Uncharacterized protein dnl_62180 [Desulfonema limicola]|uniref:Uncharacterized protein n=1 Tax=Desulfonema limicola TaxID=45656 RepID=A0A975GJS7_9BACT|nr:hypothetical protein [Desulfonema limicola]QTA83802.1 Uncharacterized protein dnl_62180 [Desulfonema limicola]
MEKGQNFNHHKKGSRIKVEPIRKFKDVKLIKKSFTGQTACASVLIMPASVKLWIISAFRKKRSGMFL